MIGFEKRHLFVQEPNCQIKNVSSIDLYTFLILQKHVALFWNVAFELHSDCGLSFGTLNSNAAKCTFLKSYHIW